jgi:hypothetical protein
VAQRSSLRFPLFAALSLGLHLATFAAVVQRRPAATPGATFDPTSGALVGDTLDVEPAAPADESEPGEPAATTGAPSQTIATPSSHGVGAHAAASGGTPGGASTPALFGAVGVRYATDLATTFTRGFPQAASADAIWSGAAFGAAGTADVVLVLDDGGHLVSTEIRGSPSEPLRRGIERTLVLMRPRTFTARGATTKLRVTARVTRDEVHDGLHGDVFALSGGSFAGQVGTAFFALPAAGGAGRRIDVELRLIP